MFIILKDNAKGQRQRFCLSAGVTGYLLIGGFMNEKQIFKMGAAAFKRKENPKDNPFDDTQQPEEHEAWRLGFSEESAYWEHQYGINVHGR